MNEWGLLSITSFKKYGVDVKRDNVIILIDESKLLF